MLTKSVPTFSSPSQTDPYAHNWSVTNRITDSKTSRGGARN